MYTISQMEICLGVRECTFSLRFTLSFAMPFPDHYLRAWNALYSNIENVADKIFFDFPRNLANPYTKRYD